PVEKTESAAFEMAALLKSMDQVRDDDLVLDIGCGPGMMAPWFARMLGGAGRYVGFDTDLESIEWCRTRFRDDDRLRFEVSNTGARFPVLQRPAGFVLAKSIFTHLTAAEARDCLVEIRRVLAPGRTALVTAFLFDGTGGAARAHGYFPFASPDGTVRWRWKAR